MDIYLRTSPICALFLTLRAQKNAQKEKPKQNRVHLSTSFCFAPPSNDFQPFIAANKLLLPTGKPSGPICRIQCQLIGSSYYLVISNSVSVICNSRSILIFIPSRSKSMLEPQLGQSISKSKLLPLNSLCPHFGQNILYLCFFTLSTAYKTSSYSYFPFVKRTSYKHYNSMHR